MEHKEKDTPPVLDQWRWLVQRLFALLSGMAAAGNAEKAAGFRADLSTCTRDLLNPASGESIDAAARKCLALCQDFFQHTDSVQVNYEAEYSAIIDTMREALRTLAAQANLDGTIIGSAARFREMAQIEDICVLRSQIAAEVQVLEQAVLKEKSQREQTEKALNDRVQSLEQNLSKTRERLNRTEAEGALDPLTRLSNRRHLDATLSTWMEPSLRGHSFILAIFDVDDFKKINDVHGHQIGDRVLRAIARSIREVTRDQDIVARYGGEEFVLMIRNISIEKARERCEAILRAVGGQHIEYVDSSVTAAIRVTVSCGLTEFASGETAHDLLQRADKALYRAKKLGKNRIEIQKPVRPSEPQDLLSRLW